MAVDGKATDPAAVRDEALQALRLHNAGNHTEALARAVELARAHPGSALALNLVGSLHRHAGVAAWTRSPSDETYALRHHSASLGAFSAAAKHAPACLVTALAHAKALAACHRYGDAQIQLCRALTMTESDQDDPAVHNVRYDLVICGSTEKVRKREAMADARAFMKHFATNICQDVVAREAVELLDADKLVGLAGARTRERAQFLSLCYPYSGRAQLLRAYIDLAQVRALDLHTDKKRLLQRTLNIASKAADTFDRSLVIALFHAKILFVLDEFNAAEIECRRALTIDRPNDPNEDDIPPLSVSGADYDVRVSNVRKELEILLKQIIAVAAKLWCSMISAPQQESIISVKADTLHWYYEKTDQSAANVIHEARCFVKKHKSWSFWGCPYSHCEDEKFVNTEMLLKHMCSKHPEEPWEKLQSVLDPEFFAKASKDDHSLDGITLCQDARHQEIFCLTSMQDTFESLLPSVEKVQQEPFVGMGQKDCREGSGILEMIKEKLKILPEDVVTTEFEVFRFEILNLWLKYLETSVCDYREVILPLARSFQWVEIKRAITHAVNSHGTSIGDINIDVVFGNLLAGAIPSQGNIIVHQNGDDPPINNLKPSNSDETLGSGEKFEESEEKAGMSRNQPSVDRDNELFILRLILQSLCSLRYYREKFLTEPLAWIPSVDNPCVAKTCPEICAASMMNNNMAESTPTSNKHTKNLFVDTSVGRIKLRINLNESCINLKRSIEKKIGHAIDGFTLRFGCRILDGMETLRSYGLTDNSILELNPKLLGGANPPGEQKELETLLDYRRGSTVLVETFQIPSIQTPKATQDTDELTNLGRRLGRSLVEPFVAAWQMNLSWDGKLKEKNIRIRDGRAEIMKEPTERLTRLSWKNDCNTLATTLRKVFLRNGKNPPYMADLIDELQNAKGKWFQKKWFRVFIRFNLSLKSSLCRGHVSYDIIRMYDNLSPKAKKRFQRHVNSVPVKVWTTGTAQCNHIFKPTCDYQLKRFKKPYPKTAFGCFRFQRNFDTHGKFPYLFAEIPIPAILGNYVSQVVKTLLKKGSPIEQILKDE